MAWLALAVYLIGVTTAVGLRSWLHYRATGDTGHRHSHPRPGNAEWWAQALLAAAILLGAAALTLGATGVLSPISALDRLELAIAGFVMALAGFAGVLTAQQAMGASWRIGVDPAERTPLVTGGVFRLVRNPVFTAMIVAMTGLTAMVPNWLQLLALACLAVGLELQVRAVEEPYLAKTHGAAYLQYAARTGRFIPIVGRVSRAGSGTRNAQR